MVAVLTALYVLAGYALLGPLHVNIAFTQKELQGVDAYERLSIRYFNEALRNQKNEKFEENLEYRRQFQDIGDNSNLILDPELSSYYAAKLLFGDVLLYMEHILSPAANTPVSHHDLPFHSYRLNHAVNAICTSPSASCASLKLLAEDLKNKLSQDVLSEPEGAKTLIMVVQELTRTTTRILREFLEKRLDTQLGQQRILLAELVCIYVFLVFLLGYSIVNVVRKNELKHAREAQRLLAQLARKNDELEKFAHAAAHDLKEPVRTMSCYATLLKSEAGDLTQECAEYISVIEGAAKRAEQMINDLLSYSQVSEKPLELMACDSAKEISTVLEDMKPVVDRLQPTITMAKLPAVLVVPSMFRRLMTNLLDNAIKYRRLGAPPNIHIKAEKENAFWHFSVADNGIGIARKDIKSVFEPFKRLNPEHRHEGQGIGLTSCKKIVERLGGRIWITSDLDEGTTVHFTIPVHAEAASSDRGAISGLREFFKRLLNL